MKCSKCGFENRDVAKFCKECGDRLGVACPRCGKANHADSKFCDECGCDLEAKGAEISPYPEVTPSLKCEPIPDQTTGMSERKYITVLFSDLSGYTAMTEKLDPEDVKAIMGRIFGELAQIVVKYEGCIEKFIGDAILALFGVPYAHEDDAVRAIRAAREIHDVVKTISSSVEPRIERPLFMHTGINTGLVVTGEVNLGKGTHGVLGDAINVASRLSGLAKTDEVVVGLETYHQAEGHFYFERLEPAKVKGKGKLIHIYKVLSAREPTTQTHGFSGLRAELVGRRVEMGRLTEAVDNLMQGKGSIFAIIGDAGTGKSRLIEEFKATLDLDAIRWRQGHAYAYAQNIPYFPLIDLFNRSWQINEMDSPERVKQKVETRAKALIGEREELIPFIGSLYSLPYKEIEGISPESWKTRLCEAIQLILTNLCHESPTVVCIEDLHWADPSSVELLRKILTDFRYPALFLCVYRSVFNLFTAHEVIGLKKVYNEIRLQDLPPSDAQTMVESLLKTDTVPKELKMFLNEKAEGNPFYLEEVIDSLLEREILIREDGSWKLARPLTDKDVPLTVQGVISARLDRLERETKRILQEASVIGRAFLYKILQRISELKDFIDRDLISLERLDIIKTRSLQPDIEYIFKHALTQEVVYNGLLKKERQIIHERIGRVMEELFRDRIPEFYETLAYHFMQGKSILKGVEYLMKAGEKSLNRYALDEAHQYYQEAFTLLSEKPDKSLVEQDLIIDILIRWSFVYFYRGSFGDIHDLLVRHKDIAESSRNMASKGLFYYWIGVCLWQLAMYVDSCQNLRKALEIGEEISNQQVIAYACTWLMWSCTELGKFDDATLYGTRAIELSNLHPSDHFLFSWSRQGMVFLNYYKGTGSPCIEGGKELLGYGLRNSDERAVSAAYMSNGIGYLTKNDLTAAIASFKKALEGSVDPLFLQYAKIMLGACYFQSGQMEEAEKASLDVVSSYEKFGSKAIEIPARLFLGAVSVLKGDMARGFEMMEEAKRSSLKSERKYMCACADYYLGVVYSQLAEGGHAVSFSTVAKNIGFLIKNVPFAARKAQDHFQAAIRLATEIGARDIVGCASLNLGHLSKVKKRNDEARTYITDAILIFEECESDNSLKQAREELASLG